MGQDPWFPLKNLLVTGGLGFIGTNFIHKILRSEKDTLVTNVDNESLGSNHVSLREFERNKQYRFVKGDLADYSFTRMVLRKATTVVNFAAQTHVDRSIANSEPFFESNVRSVFNIVRATRQIGGLKKVVHISTDEVFGSIDKGSFDENSRFNPSSPYSATKAAAELLVNGWNKTFNLGIVTIRCTNNFGPWQHPEKFIPKSIIRSLEGEGIPLYGGGSQVRDWIHVEDFCRAIQLAVDIGIPGEAYNISAGNELSNKEVAKRLLRQLKPQSAKLISVEDRPGHDLRYSLNSNKARRDLGWKPSQTFDEALAATVRWYKQHIAWWKPLATKKVLSDVPWKKKW